MTRRRPRRKVAYSEPVPQRLAPNTIIESTLDVGRRCRCTMRVERGRLDPGAVIRQVPGRRHRRMPERLDEGEWRTGAPATMRVYRFAALTVGAWLAVGDG
jgi:hypothetical protein